jgi:hypothetical protein
MPNEAIRALGAPGITADVNVLLPDTTGTIRGGTMFGKRFWRATAERAVKTFAQSLVAVLSAGQLGLFDVEWLTVLSTAGMATVLSLLSSLASTQVGEPSDPSAVPTSPGAEPALAKLASA